MFNFFVVWAGLDMVADNESATTCRGKSKAPSLKTNTKNEGPSENMAFI